jgi:hypothetical protein
LYIAHGELPQVAITEGLFDEPSRALASQGADFVQPETPESHAAPV